ncbi:MAG: transglycosylase domain-containing protein, partial [Novosphingobium sp.]|nr:transglycosylase domain-containing protein [Novosphingobium sp.]
MPSRTNARRSGPTGGRPQPEPQPTRWRRVVGALLRWGIGLGLVVAVFVGVSVYLTARELPGFEELKSSQAGQTIVVRARDGTELVSLGPSYGRWLAYDEIPQIMKDAMVTVEDRRFHSHFGIDPIGVTRSLWVRLETGSWRQGGSTITQQLARNIFLNNN